MHREHASSALWLAAVVIAVAAAVMVLRSPVSADHHAILQPALPAKPSVAAPTLGNPVNAVLLADDLAAAMRGFRALDYRQPMSVSDLRTLIDQSCRVPALLRMDGRSRPDWRRDRFRHALEQRCRNWAVPSMWVAESSSDIFVDDPVLEARPADLLAELHSARTASAVRRAWWNAYVMDALPQAQIFADQRRLLPAEARQLIDVVIDWRACARFQACGPDSVYTLRVCALHGCRGDEDLLAAWHGALSPRDFESALAISRWLPVWSEADE